MVRHIIIIAFSFFSWLRLQAQDSVLIFHELAAMPSTPKDGASSFVIDSDLFVIGGSDSAGYFSSEVWKYHVPTNAWSRMSDFPGGAIYSGGAFSINRKGYICGGLAQNTSFYHSTWEYTPTSDNWTQKNDYPGASFEAQSCFSRDSLGYLGLGYDGPCNDLSVYKPFIDQWTVLDTLPASGRYGCSPIVNDSFAYFFGGYYRYIYGHANHETWRFNLNSNYWEQLSSMPGTDRGWSATWSVGKFIICALGTHADSILDYQADKYIYSISSDTWKPIRFQNFWDSISTGYSFMIGNTGYYFGGLRQINPYFLYTNRLFSFDATPLLTTGIAETKADIDITVSPNPVSALGMLTVSVPEDGELRFTDGLGRLLYTTLLRSGSNAIPCDELHAQEGIVFYSIQLRHDTANGKILIIR